MMIAVSSISFQSSSKANKYGTTSRESDVIAADANVSIVSSVPLLRNRRLFESLKSSYVAIAKKPLIFMFPNHHLVTKTILCIEPIRLIIMAI
jgi:hypothetical protein